VVAGTFLIAFCSWHPSLLLTSLLMLASLPLLLDFDAHGKFTAATASVTLISINPAVASDPAAVDRLFMTCVPRGLFMTALQ
jgi:hypothetical protein